MNIDLKDIIRNNEVFWLEKESPESYTTFTNSHLITKKGKIDRVIPGTLLILQLKVLRQR